MSGAAAPDQDPFDPEILEQEADREPGASMPEAMARRAALPPRPDERLRLVSDPPLASSERSAEAPARRTHHPGAGGRSDDDLPV